MSPMSKGGHTMISKALSIARTLVFFTLIASTVPLAKLGIILHYLR